MEPRLVQRLAEINQTFYRRFAAEFAQSRSPSQPGLQRVLDGLPLPVRVLDVGCGDGRIAHLLERNLAVGGAKEDAGDMHTCEYLGLDFSQESIHLARRAAKRLGHVEAEFAVVDLLQPDWALMLGRKRFGLILALAVLHHIPALANRLDLLKTWRSHLEPGGHLVVSVWQFTTSPRMRRKIISWDCAGVDPGTLEAGDYLLDWKRGGVGYRYCHLVDPAELAGLAAGAGLALLETFRADGQEGDLSLYGVMTA